MSKERGKSGRGQETSKRHESPSSELPVERRGYESPEIARILGRLLDIFPFYNRIRPKMSSELGDESHRDHETHKLSESSLKGGSDEQTPPSIKVPEHSEVPSEDSDLQVRIERLADDMWVELPRETQIALEELASRIMEPE
jgi:hypothetical protein